MIPKKATPATGQETRADKVRREVQVTKIVGTFSSESRLYPFYSDIKQSAPAKFLSLADLVCMAIDPSIGPKHKAAALSPDYPLLQRGYIMNKLLSHQTTVL